MLQRAVSFLVLSLLLAGFGWAQLPTATLNGIVTDPQGAVVSGATVTTISQATGETRTVRTGGDGRYAIPNLAPGDYDVSIEGTGFAKRQFKAIRLEVGRNVTLDVPLGVAKVGEVVTVTGGESQIQLTQSQIQGQIASSTIENIPLNGRNFLELAFLLPGNRPATNFDPTKTNTLEVSSAGQFGRGGNITVDGGDNNDEVVGGTLINFPQDGIAEFQIATNKYTAEVGRSASSIINIVTKPGTNDVHGSAFIFFRHKALQALPATFDRSQPTPRFVREQFGGSVGGPIIKDKAFWFVSSEYRNQDHAVPVQFRDFAIRDVIDGSAPAFLHDFLLTSRGDYKPTNSDSIGVRYSFERSLDIDNGSLRKPAGTAANRQQSFNRYNSVLADWTRVLSPTRVNSLIFHVDTFLNKIPAFNDNNAVTNPAGLAAGNEIRFPTLQDGANFRIPQQTPLNRYQLRDTFNWVKGAHTLRFGGEWQNSGAGVVFDLFGSGTIFTTETFATQDRNGDGFIDDRDIPIAVALRSAAPVRPPSAPTSRNNYFGLFVQDDWRVRPNLTINAGLRWEVDNDVLGQTDQNKACPDLTTVPSSPCEFIRNIIGPADPRKFKNFGPRLGFAWDPFNRGKTVVRGGYGIYYDRVVLEVPILETLLNGRILPLQSTAGSTLNGAGNFAPDLTTGQIVSLANPFGGESAVFGIGVNVVDNHAGTPYVQQFTFGAQQQFGQNWTVSVDGVHNFGQRFLIGRFMRNSPAGVNSPFLVCPNGVDPCTITDPATGRSDQVTNIESSAKTWYDGMLVSLSKRPTGTKDLRWGFNVNYTLSKTFNFANDDQIPFNGAEDQVNLIFHTNNLRLEKGYAPTDERHRFVFYGIFEAPWQLSVSPIWTWASSVPMDSLVPALTARLPNIRRNALGRDIPDGTALNAAIQQWNALPACTGAVGGPVPCHAGATLLPVDPNLSFGDDFNAFDLRITKTFNFTERQKLQFISEVFNLFNITNIRGTNNTNYSGFNNDITATSAPAFNQPINTAGKFFGAGGPRAFQFALRYAF